MNHIAVIDIGKTNVKLALVEAASLTEIALLTQPNIVLSNGPWPHFDLMGIWSFLQTGLSMLQNRYGIDAVSITTHGAAVVLIGENGHAFPMLDYEYSAPDCTAAGYNLLRSEFAMTGSPRLPMGLNIGAQLHWMFETAPELRKKLHKIITYPQYWGYLLTGELASDITSLGCHTDLWAPYAGQFSPTLKALGLEGFFAEARRPNEVLGDVRQNLANQLGLSKNTPVMVGIHDSNASLYPYLLGRDRRFSVASTGTWVIVMAVGGDRIELDPERDTLVNVSGLGQPVPTARFMGGREYEIIRNGRLISPTHKDRDQVLSKDLHLRPAVEASTGPYQGRALFWSAHAETPGQEMVALSYYLALMTRTCLDLIGAAGPLIVEGPFIQNKDYLAMLAATTPDGLMSTQSKTGTSVGAALLCCDSKIDLQQIAFDAHEAHELLCYARSWRKAVDI